MTDKEKLVEIMAQAYCKSPLTNKAIDPELVDCFSKEIIAAGFGNVKEMESELMDRFVLASHEKDKHIEDLQAENVSLRKKIKFLHGILGVGSLGTALLMRFII